MTLRQFGWWLVFGSCCSAAPGCLCVPRSELDRAQAHSQMLAEKNRSLEAELANQQRHRHDVENQLAQAEEELAELDEQLSGKRTARGIPAALGKRLAKISQQHPALEFDAATGAAKLDTDVLFDSGEARLRDEARPMLDDVAEVLTSPEARDLRIMVVGHADARKVAKAETRQRYPDNWHLAAARALSVAEYLQKAGVREEQIGVTSLGRHEPVASNDNPRDRQRNRRVEIFVTGPDTPIVGWHDDERQLR